MAETKKEVATENEVAKTETTKSDTPKVLLAENYETKVRFKATETYTAFFGGTDYKFVKNEVVSIPKMIAVAQSSIGKGFII